MGLTLSKHELEALCQAYFDLRLTRLEEQELLLVLLHSPEYDSALIREARKTLELEALCTSAHRPLQGRVHRWRWVAAASVVVALGLGAVWLSRRGSLPLDAPQAIAEADAEVPSAVVAAMGQEDEPLPATAGEEAPDAKETPGRQHVPAARPRREAPRSRPHAPKPAAAQAEPTEGSLLATAAEVPTSQPDDPPAPVSPDEGRRELLEGESAFAKYEANASAIRARGERVQRQVMEMSAASREWATRQHGGNNDITTTHIL